MKRVRINPYRVGLLYKKGRFDKILEEGSYWKFGNENIVEYELSKIYNAPPEISDLKTDMRFSEIADVVEVKDNERLVVMADGIFRQVLQPGKYILWKGLVSYELITLDMNNVHVPEAINPAVLLKPELSFYTRVFKVETYEKGVLYINGKFVKLLEPGVYTYLKNEIPIVVDKADMRQQQLDINGQEILTKDKAALRLNLYALYKVNDIQKAIVDNKDVITQLYTMLQLSIREYVGGYTLDELLEKKNEIAILILESVKEKVSVLGISITDCGIKDIILPGDVKEIMNKVLIAQKNAQANTITRREETAATRSLLNTAKLMEENEMLFRMKEMEYVEKIAEKINGISVSGNGDLIGQLSKIFVPDKNAVVK